MLDLVSKSSSMIICFKQATPYDCYALRHVQVEVERQDQLREAAEYRVALQDALKEAEAEARRVELERELEERARREEEERLARKQVLAIFMHNEYARL